MLWPKRAARTFQRRGVDGDADVDDADNDVAGGGGGGVVRVERVGRIGAWKLARVSLASSSSDVRRLPVPNTESVIDRRTRAWLCAYVS